MTGRSLRAATRPPVLLIGDGPTALAALRSLVRCCAVLGVLRSTGDGSDSPVHSFAAEHGIPVRFLGGVRDLPEIIQSLKPEAVVISSFSRIVPPDILESSRFINVHYSPLPRYRGRANVNWAIINGEPTAAISIHAVAPGLDDGNILFQRSIEIVRTDTAQTLYERLNAIQEAELGSTVVRAIAGHRGTPQDHRLATYGCGRIPADGEIDWNQPSLTIDRLIRALAPPFPGAFTFLDRRRLVIVRAEPRQNPPLYEGRVPGRVVNRSSREGWIDVLTGDGVLRVSEMALEDAASMPAASMVMSTRSTLGLSRLDLFRWVGALEERIAILEKAVRATGVDRSAYDAFGFGEFTPS